LAQEYCTGGLSVKKLTRERGNVHFYVDAGNKPKLRVAPRESFCLETIRADNMFLHRGNPVFRDRREVMSVQANPVTGPVYVEGAESGDRLALTIEDIRLGDCGNEGYYTYVPGQGLFANPFLPDTRFCDVSGDTFTLRIGGRSVQVETEPFIGTVCVAVPGAAVLSYDANKHMVGNVDCPHLKKGSTVVMPVHVPDALLSLGDLHAKQGDGELLGCAVEADGAVTLSAALIKAGDGGYFDLPQINDRGVIGSVCTVPNNIEAAIRGAVYDVIKRVETDCRIPFMDAYMLAGQCVKVRHDVV
jgi:acetamidase/formamidase